MSKKRLGFTLVELLVVISIIGVLIGLLLPAVQAAREAARRTQCLNDERQFGIALQQYDSQNGAFPGFQLAFPGTTSSTTLGYPASWVIHVLPFMDRMDIYNFWKENIPKPYTGQSFTLPTPLVQIGVCPNNQPADTSKGDWLAYRVNTGYNRVIPNPVGSLTAIQITNRKNFIVAEGVCTDQWNPNSVKVGTSYISSKDGTSTTLLLAERSATTDTLANPWTWDKSSSSVSPYCFAVESLGFNWENMKNLDPPTTNAAYMPSKKMSSNHPGGVIVGFCGGNHKFMKSDLDPMVYMQLMAPSDRDVGGSDPVDNIPTPTSVGIWDPTVTPINGTIKFALPLDEAKIP
jgi:prepilin-type N-terminal cleavage/methylation domain-containing protein